MTYRISILGLLVVVTVNSISSSPSLSNSDTSLNTLYENLLQREYAGPISFPDHQVERKAQRSPSLRLRFGRTDPSMLVSAEKRWFGDVNQKPIRSPSLRLRFGKRGDDLLDMDDFNELDEYNPGFGRLSRPPSKRLRWGRSIPFGDFNIDNEQIRNEDASIENESLRALLSALRELDEKNFISEDFTRQIRKPAPLRLRWGRSTGWAPSADHLNAKESTVDGQQLNNNKPTSASASQIV